MQYVAQSLASRGDEWTVHLHSWLIMVCCYAADVQTTECGGEQAPACDTSQRYCMSASKVLIELLLLLLLPDESNIAVDTHDPREDTFDSSLADSS